MDESKKEGILRKVRALLAKANSTEYEGERQVFMAKADELMSVYAIEEWQLAKDDNSQVKPEKRMTDMSWYSMEGISDGLWRLYLACARHARCVIIHDYYNGREVPVVGLPADLDYLDLLFTDLMMQLIGQLDPAADKSLDYYENLKRMREAGNSWPRVAEKMLAAGFDPRPNDASTKVKQDQMTRDYRAWCKKAGVPQNYNHFKTYSRNFAEGFAGALNMRFHEMRQSSQGESNPSGSMALAIRDIRQVIAEAVAEMFPVRAKGGRSIADNRKTDHHARTSGSSAGQKARIASNATKLAGRRAIGS